MNHRCKEKDRLDELQTLIGQQAYLFYTEWMKVQGRKAPPIETFATSKFYTTFIKFAQHVTRTQIPNPLNFIKVMTGDGITPAMWTRDEIYSAYLQSYDQTVPPDIQVLATLELINILCMDYECAPDQLFMIMKIDKLADLIRQRKLSPWLLLASAKFRTWIRGLPHQDGEIIKQAINLGAMSIRIQQEAILFAEFGKIAQEVGL